MPQRAHKPTDKARELVQILAGHGIPHDEIGLAIGTTAKTLRRHYLRELGAGMALAKARVLTTAFEMATSGRCPAMTIFWLKTRLGWRERGEPEREPQSPADLTTAQLVAEIRAKRAEGTP